MALGNDTHTTACIAGGLAGIHFGFEAIPLRWMDALRGRDLVKPLERALLLRA
ncbi:ADP-ribosylglycohydrolase family protein [Noviherbaspirillum sp. Root189]|uniref:ADP-ribosylglycohydrolase family protein n=1 Tax=Noviherbaspirillum sp. Root189 TaxID=1736487 RepID=UPI0009ECB11C|nr:ADP-ribosylglycohydrolase family protein [Noviherbaspirillum sp. Root189]